MKNFKRKRGFLVFAQNSDTDYLRLAYGLALSIRATQKENPYLCVVVTPGQKIPDAYREVFDSIVTVPWIDEAKSSTWKLENEWKAIHASPYEETIKLDADMLMTSDISAWWDVLASRDVWAATSAYTYRGEEITSDLYRKVFTANDLPNIYTAFMYFKSSAAAHELFDMAELIYHNWEKFFFEYLDDTRPKFVSTDVVFALAMKLTGMSDEMTAPNFRPLGQAFPAFVHMKSRLQNWGLEDIEENWLAHITGTVTPSLEVKIGRFSQDLPLHYHRKEFLTDQIIRAYEKAWAA